MIPPHSLLHIHDPSLFPFPHMGFKGHDSVAAAAAAVDFRAFYPYTPNEVKHRKRTTSNQLKTLEAIFKRDTKPNATLRNELAQQLDMTARGVQVWFQNRRAKEKTKSAKAVSAKSASLVKLDPSNNDDLSFNDSEILAADSPPVSNITPHDSSEHLDVSSQGSSPTVTSPPQLHLITDSTNIAWKPSTADPPPSHATLINRSTALSGNDLYALRRGSLPVNAFPPSDDSRSGSPIFEGLDPLVRRRSVDASLQRLAYHPFANLCRAKNGALFGPRYGVAPPGKHYPLHRSPYGSLPHRTGISPHSPLHQSLSIRRSSMDSRPMRFSARSGVSPSPSPLSPYVRASLPDQSLYTVTSRPLVSPIPGPLPSPDFSFGAASTPSMASPSSGDSERNSPDSLRSFTFNREDYDEDDGASTQYEPYSRFCSIASVATSESSFQSSYYPEIGHGVDHDQTTDLHAAGRRQSCTTEQFLDLMPGLDINAHSAIVEPIVNVYPQHEEYKLQGESIIQVTSELMNESCPSFPSPTSTISAGNISPHVDETGVQHISQSSELAYALQSLSDQAQDVRQQEHPPQVTYEQHQHHHQVKMPSEPGHEHQDTAPPPCYYAQQPSEHMQQQSIPDIPQYDRHKYQLDEDCSLSMSQGHYTLSGSYAPLGDYADSGDMSLHQPLDYARCVQAGLYTGYASDHSLLAHEENAFASVSAFTAYT